MSPSGRMPRPPAGALSPAIAKLSRLSPLEDEAVSLLNRLDRLSRHPGGAALAREGEAPPPGFLISGWAARVRRLPDGRRQILGLLVPGNSVWAQHASVLMLILSDTLTAAPGSTDYKPLHSHSFDAGAAWMALALQATRMGYRTHAMAGVDFDRARAELAVPDRFRLEAAVAIGRQADKAILPEALQAREMPSGRKPIEDFAFAGNFRD